MTKLTQIEQLLLKDYPSLDINDRCYFLGEYAARQGFQHSDMNQLINNLKKPMGRKPLSEWAYKLKAIEEIASLIYSLENWNKLKQWTWVPIPSSKRKSEPDYDDRLLQILLKIKEKDSILDVREILSSKDNRDPAHLQGGKRLSIGEHFNNLEVDKTQIEPSPRGLIVFDDVITTGASFKASKMRLKEHFKEIPIVGIFIARNTREL